MVLTKDCCMPLLHHAAWDVGGVGTLCNNTPRSRVTTDCIITSSTSKGEVDSKELYKVVAGMLPADFEVRLHTSEVRSFPFHAEPHFYQNMPIGLLRLVSQTKNYSDLCKKRMMYVIT